MTIKDLIKKLQEYPEDMLVMREAVEYGYKDVEKIKILKIKRNVNDLTEFAWYAGPHDDEDSYGYHQDKDVPIEQVLVI